MIYPMTIWTLLRVQNAAFFIRYGHQNTARINKLNQRDKSVNKLTNDDYHYYSASSSYLVCLLTTLLAFITPALNGIILNNLAIPKLRVVLIFAQKRCAKIRTARKKTIFAQGGGGGGGGIIGQKRRITLPMQGVRED